MSKNSKKENRVYVGNLSYDVKYGDLMEFMRGGGWMMDFMVLVFWVVFLVVVVSGGGRGKETRKGYGEDEECGMGSWRGLSASRPSPPLLFLQLFRTGRA
jgi:hypothetical protein